MSKMPNPDEGDRRLSIEEFLSRESSNSNLEGYQDLIGAVRQLNVVIPRSIPAVDGMPDLWIATNRSIDGHAMDMINTIFITQGMLDFSLRVGLRATPILQAAAFDLLFGKETLSRLFFLWSYAHEVVHILRRHELLLNHFGRSRDILHATEFDADVCSVACIYRMIRAAFPMEDPFRCKVQTLTGVFWAMRTLADLEGGIDGTETHPAFIARLIDVAKKLAMIVDSGYPDVIGSRPETKRQFSELHQKVGELERLYMCETHPGSGSNESLLHRYLVSGQMSAIESERGKAWDKMAEYVLKVQTLPRAAVSNEADVTFIEYEHPRPVWVYGPMTARMTY